MTEPQRPESPSPLADLLEQRQSLTAEHVREAVLELLKFYSARGRYFRRSLFRSPTNSRVDQFNNASVMASSSILHSLRALPRLFDEKRRRKIENLCLDSLRRYLNPKAVYPATSSDAFGDFNPFACAFLLKEVLRHSNLCQPLPPLALRLSVRAILAYLRTSYTFDPSRMVQIFGARSMWSLPENHPIVVFRCIDALNELRAFMVTKRPSNDWTRRLFVRLSPTGIRTIVGSATQKVRREVRRRLQWIERDLTTSYSWAPLRTEHVADQLTRVLEEYEAWTFTLADAEVARHRRQLPTESDPSALAALTAIIAISSKAATHTQLIENLRALFENLEPRGTWSAGRPFFYDETGGAYHCVSIEIGCIALRAIMALDERLPRLAMDRVYDELHERVFVVHRWIEAERRTIVVDNKPALFVLDARKSSECKGWANDRSPGVNRIDSWMAALVIDFLCSDYVLRKNLLRRLILNKYPVILNESCTPRWDGFVDPDLGDAGSAKKKIAAACLKATPEKRAVSILLYGPPGTSKTTLVRALAGELGYDLLQLSAGDFVADGFELLENWARRIFRDLSRLENVLVLFDEMDPLIRGRLGRLKDLGTTISDYVIPGMLPKLQDFRDYCVRSNMVFVIVTNFRDVVDRAASRGGRIDLECLILPYTRKARSRQLEELIVAADVTVNAQWQSVIGQLVNQSALMVYRDLLKMAEALLDEYRSKGGNRNAVRAAAASPRVRAAAVARTVRLDEYRPRSGQVPATKSSPCFIDSPTSGRHISATLRIEERCSERLRA